MKRYIGTVNSDIKETVKNCTKCAEFQRKQPSEPLMPSQTPELPFSEVGTDLFEFECKANLLTVKTTIEALKAQFERHGTPKVIRSDSGPQYTSEEFARFCKYLTAPVSTVRLSEQFRQ